MPPKQGEKSPVVIPSRHVGSRTQSFDGAYEETEIAAQISVPYDGGWAWVVLFASFMCIFILDGVIFTFGSVIKDISVDLVVEDSLVAVINSVECALYFSLSPLASALINRFGFRACTLIGSVVCCVGLFASYLSGGFAALLIFNGIVTGFGCAMVNMGAGLVVGFYFEKLRAIALAISCCGTSAGITVLFPVFVKLVNLSGWRSVMLLNAGLHGIIFFLGMAFRPLLSVTVTNAEVDPQDRTRTVTYLPSLSAAGLRLTVSKTGNKATNTERMFGAVSNYNFPTAASVVGETVSGAATTAGTPQAGPSTAPSMPRLALTTQGAISQRQLKQVQSIVSRPNVQDKNKSVEIAIRSQEKKPTTCCGRWFHWEPHAPESRPLYRDDAFYDGKIEKLPVYQKSMADVTPANKTGLEYQMAVSRAVTTADLQEKRGIFTTAVRRVLATMMDFQILKKRTFQFYCAYGFLTYAGVMVPYVYIKDRNQMAGVSEVHCAYFVSVIAFGSAIGRLGLSTLAMKWDPVTISAWCSVAAGVSTALSGISYNVAFQYGYCLFYGITTAGVNCLRSLVLVKLYGLEKLTNATGMYFIFLGFGNIFSTPVGGMLKNNFGYNIAFYVAGGFLTLAGISVFIMMCFEKKEKKYENNQLLIKEEMVKKEELLKKTELLKKELEKPKSSPKRERSVNSEEA